VPKQQRITPEMLDWEGLEQEVVERLRMLKAAVSDKLEASPAIRQKIFEDLVLPNVALLAEFCANVTIEEDPLDVPVDHMPEEES
jgi:cell division FtsZ-interacting protein ZapD